LVGYHVFRNLRLLAATLRDIARHGRPRLPAGAERLASTALYANQAFAWGRRALGLQFHVEVTARRLDHWLVGHAAEIAATPGVTVAGLRADTARWGPPLAEAGRRALARWLDRVEAG